VNLANPQRENVSFCRWNSSFEVLAGHCGESRLDLGLMMRQPELK
jgi:hypothetical protein